MNLQSGSIFIELVGIVVGSVLTIPLIDDDVEIKLLTAAVVADVTPPIKEAVEDPDDDEEDDWLTSRARKLFSCVIKLAFCFWRSSHLFLYASTSAEAKLTFCSNVSTNSFFFRRLSCAEI